LKTALMALIGEMSCHREAQKKGDAF
jgi:hypothetical protein